MIAGAVGVATSIAGTSVVTGRGCVCCRRRSVFFCRPVMASDRLYEPWDEVMEN
ncbi:hypothetical protein PF005_g33578 [Phytophthora fragariae]|uniref:Uncharacterized protein n=1 Tax=Phytophthora fragariae TaxID=53985 RepID=A0A6A3UYQ3_9STRA|nr:hypothetical protein PF009_g33358 [Phytophthora fragariae]KAE8951322.1 hypothetical protein PF011_g33004 [Phytophthora fragariae]KAE9050165.1 hypothetical protein PF010_g33179 [Phytophthora fragariae]KAE9053327.1 hypothetical protein PF007_g32978 [Phytophthora fragariae]KAE9054643.1 hypothetical protein PF006_g33206 [Phytophthora fragariae]